MELKKYVVVKDAYGDFTHWTKEFYDNYVKKALRLGATPACVIVTHFNGDEDLLTEQASPDGWVAFNPNKLPLETQIIIEHKHGIEGIHFFNHKWAYWYSGKEVDPQVFETAIRFMIPKKDKL